MRSETRSDSRLFGDLLRSLLKDGISVRFRASGSSMYPAIKDGDLLQVDPLKGPHRGDVVMANSEEGLRVHRVVNSGGTATRGDCCFDHDSTAGFIGIVSLADRERTRQVPAQRLSSTIRRWIARIRGHF